MTKMKSYGSQRRVNTATSAKSMKAAGLSNEDTGQQPYGGLLRNTGKSLLPSMPRPSGLRSGRLDERLAGVARRAPQPLPRRSGRIPQDEASTCLLGGHERRAVGADMETAVPAE